MSTTETMNMKDRLLNEHASFINLYKSGNAHVNTVRENAINAFAALGLPNKRNEEYKYANVEKIFTADYSLDLNPSPILDKQTVESCLVPGLDAYKIVLVNGIYSAELSDTITEQGITVCALGEAFERFPTEIEKHFDAYTPTETDGFAALNSAFAHNGVYIHIAAKTIVTKPLWVLNIGNAANNALLQSRNLIIAERFAEAKVVSFFASVSTNTNSAISNTVTELYVGENATLHHYRVQNGGSKTVQVQSSEAHVEANAKFISNNITLNGAWVRNNLNISLNGQNGSAELYGLYLPQGTSLVDNHTLVDHRVPNCYSEELYKGIADDESIAVFNGKIFVRKDAQKTNAFQSNKNILLTDSATVYTKPQLEIYADDVKCSHGSSTGQLDDDALFYLRSRGLGESSARALLMYAFANDVINHIEIEPLREYIDGLVSQRFLTY